MKILFSLLIMSPLIVLCVSMCTILMIVTEIKHMIKSWHIHIKNPFSSKWIKGSFSGGYFKLPIFTFIRFNAELIKLPKESSVEPHFDESYSSYRDMPCRRYRYIRLNFNLKNSKGGDFICSKAYINNRFLAIYEPDIQYHAFNRVSKGTKFILSFGILI